MGGQESSLEGVSVGGRPLDNPLQITYIGTCVAKETREDVAGRLQLATQVVRANNYRQGELSPTG